MFLHFLVNIVRRHYLVMVPLALALMSLYSIWTPGDPSMDGVTYIQIARNILSGKGLGWQALWATPLHPALIAGASLLSGSNDLLHISTVVSSTMLLLLIIVVYSISCLVFSDRLVAWIAALFTSISPHFFAVLYSAEPEASYTLFLCASLLLLIMALKRLNPLLLILTGIFFSLAYMSRSEGFIVMVLCMMSLMTYALTVRAARLKTAMNVSIVLISFFVASLPYLMFLHKHYGSFVISPKSSYVMTWMKWKVYQDNDKGEAENEDLWGLNSEGVLKWQEPKGIADLVAYLGGNPRKSISVYLRNLLSEIPGRIPNSAGMQHFPQVFPVYFALAALLALCRRWDPQNRLETQNKIVLTAPFLILLILPIFTGGWHKYLTPYLPVLLILSAKGIDSAAHAIARLVMKNRAPLCHGVLIALAVTVICFFYSFRMRFDKEPQKSDINRKVKMMYKNEPKIAAEFGKKIIGTNRNVMIGWSPLAYYLNSYWIAFPVSSSAAAIARYAEKNNVEYVAVESFLFNVSAEDIVSDMSDIPHLNALACYQSVSTSYKACFFQFKPPTR